MRLPLLIFVPFFAGLVACTSSPELEDYPERQIDRPYTLPDNVATWKTKISATQVDDGRSTLQVSLPLPLYWEQALSDNWTLEYSPLPLAIRYQIANTNSVVTGLRFGTGLGYSSLSGTIFQPHLGGYFRYKLDRNYAWENTIFYTKTFYSDEMWDDYETARLLSGPMFQLDDTKVLTPKIGVGMVRNELVEIVDYRDYRFDDDLSFLIPVTMNFTWLFHRQWEYSLDYNLNSLALEKDRLAVHRLTMGFKHYW